LIWAGDTPSPAGAPGRAGLSRPASDAHPGTRGPNREQHAGDVRAARL